MSDRELRINLYDNSKIGHANVSFYRGDEHQYTIGANIRLEVPQLAIPRILPFEPDDGIYRDESAFHLSSIVDGTIKSASVPVTDMQYDALLEEARSFENETYNYSVFTEACIEFVEAFYEATGHPGEFGDLFAEEQRTGSLVWSRVPVSDDSPLSLWPDDQPLYTPPEPLMPDAPVPPDLTVFGALPDPPIPGKPTTEIDADDALTVYDIGTPVPGEEEAEPVFSELLPDAQVEAAMSLVQAKYDEFIPAPAPQELLSGEQADDILPSYAKNESPDPFVDGIGELPAKGDPFPSDLDRVELAFPQLVDAGSGQQPDTPNFWSMESDDDPVDAFEPSEHGISKSGNASQSTGKEIVFDRAADEFDFNHPEPASDLNFGNDPDGSGLMDALSIPEKDLGYSFDSASSYEPDQAEYEHTYDEYGIFI